MIWQIAYILTLEGDTVISEFIPKPVEDDYWAQIGIPPRGNELILNEYIYLLKLESTGTLPGPVL
jgi:hypothetical protein